MTGSDQRQEQQDRSDHDEGEASGADNAAVREVLRELGVYLAQGIEERSRRCARRGGQVSGRRAGCRTRPRDFPGRKGGSAPVSPASGAIESAS